MKYIRFLLLAIALIVTIHAQEKAKQEKSRYVVIPSTEIMLMVASQTDCPFQLENPRLLYNLDENNITYQWDFRNRGTKPIVGFTVDAWRSSGTGGTLTNSWGKKGEVLMPGEVVKDNMDEKQIVPLTKELREQLKLNGKIRGMIILIVRYVEFKDGTFYDGVKTSDILSEFLGKYGDCVDEQEP